MYRVRNTVVMVVLYINLARPWYPDIWLYTILDIAVKLVLR